MVDSIPCRRELADSPAAGKEQGIDFRLYKGKVDGSFLIDSSYRMWRCGECDHNRESVALCKRCM